MVGGPSLIAAVGVAAAIVTAQGPTASHCLSLAQQPKVLAHVV